ncbi:MAG: FAD-binding and (Fe-S)-binding domain-containing protein, partial [Candidatus Binataceae bacterium]
MNRAPTVDSEKLRRALLDAGCAEVRFDTQSRALYATDASNYRQVPIGVVLPRSLDEVERIVEVCRRFDAPLTSRGGGTSLAGQCCNAAVIMDFSKYLNRVLEIDPVAKTAWVEPGCVLDDLRNAAIAHGLTFGPDPSTHNRNTLGGMAGNNSCGVHSVMSGRTADNIEELEILTYDGLRMTVGRTSEADLAGIFAVGGRKAEIYRELVAIRDRTADLVRERYPHIPRRVSGYNLDNLLPENGFNVARALVGSEGTCITILRLKCRLVHHHVARAVVILGFNDVYCAGDAVPEVLATGPIGLEGFDDKLIHYIKINHIHEEHVGSLPDGGGWLLVEFGGDDGKSAEAQAKRLTERMAQIENPPSMRVVTDQAEQDSLWKVRQAALGATAHVPNMHDTFAGWEDSSVPPNRVGAYMRDFRKLLDRYNYDCSLYGHFGDGCIHCSIDFDFSTRRNVGHFMAFIEEAADLVVSYGGSLSGEHGDGQSRAILLGKMFGPELVKAFARFKAIWDPAGRMNPGKLVAPYRPDENLREGPDHRPWSPETRFGFQADGGDFSLSATRCVGAGACRKHDSGVMCPSYMATREEKYSTRGRSRLLFEMTKGEVIRDRWRSAEVHDALDLCLACKACRSECPVRVDMTSYKSEFMHHHYRGRLRPREAYSMGLIWWWARAASRAPTLANMLTRGPLGSLAKAIGGFAQSADMPRFAEQSFHAWFAGRARPVRGPRGRVLLWPDTFNAYFTPEPLKATVALLERDGWNVEIPKTKLCCGRPLY